MVWERRRDEDEVDRVNRLWTVLILGIAGIALVLYVAVFPDDAVSCSPLSLQANRYCLSQSQLRSYVYGSYFYPDLTTYHSFVPVLLFVHILAFLFPHVLARFLAEFFGNETDFLLNCAEKSKSMKDLNDPYIESKLKSPPSPSQKLAIVFVLKKSLVLAVSLIQIVIVALIAEPQFMDSTTVRAFPVNAFCRVGDQTYHCAYNVNGIILKLYHCFFFWLIALTVMNAGSLIAWVLKLFLPRMTSNTIDNYTMTPSTDNPEKTQRFLKEVVGRDFLLNLLLAKSTEREITAGDLTLKWWQAYDPYQPTESVETAGVNGSEVPMSQM